MKKNATEQGTAPVDELIFGSDFSQIEARVMANMFAHGMTPAEQERLSMLVEEAGEIVQIGGKILRFGYESRHPDGGPTNRDLLIGELFDILAVICLMNRADLNMRFENVDAPRSKIERKLKYSHHQSGESL